MRRGLMIFAVFALLAFSVCGCMRKEPSGGKTETPPLGEEMNLNEEGVPVITVYNLQDETKRDMDVESYVEGVLAGEMKNDWPEEALKAQAILARTYVMRFLQSRKSMYEGADISTDIKEAQAYSEVLVNDRIKKAVRDTRGMVVSHEGELAVTWFHAHSGGMTELPMDGLDYSENPPYTQRTVSHDSEKAPAGVKNWSVSFKDADVIQALGKIGVKVDSIDSMKIARTTESGRAAEFEIDGKTVSAPTLRIALGSEKMKSTLITRFEKTDTGVEMEGRGYGHGVGLSQWGAFEMAENGKSAENIVKHYFKDVDIVKMWN